MTLTQKAQDGQREFTNEDFEDEVCEGLHLGSATFTRCTFLDCTFKNCDLSNASLKSSTLKDVTFENSKLLGINWTAASVLAHLKFHRSVISLGNFSNLDLRKWVFQDCIAREIELAHANMTEANCGGTDFAGSRFLQTNLTKADLRGALNYAIRPLDNTLKKTKFSLPEATSLLAGLDIILE